jgi:transglutaminase-like putative cysteine protease
MLLHVEHKFAFEYDGYISESFLELRVQPKTTAHQTVAAFGLAVGPPARVYRYADWNDNITHHFSVTKFHDRIEVGAQSVVDTRSRGLALASLSDPIAPGDVAYPLLDFLAFTGPVRLTPALRAAHRDVALARGATLGEHVLAIGAAIHERCAYRKEVTTYASTTEDFLKFGAGVCQDFTHLMLGLLRLSGIPCRYVSGYLHVERKKREAGQSHAWIEVHSPTAGWVAFDPTHNRPVDEHYVVVGHGRHYDDVPPNRGIYRGVAKELLRAEVHTEPISARAIPRLVEEVRPIDLQVFASAPTRRPETALRVDEEAQQQQQQQ